MSRGCRKNASPRSCRPQWRRWSRHAEGGQEPLPEGLLWLLLTGELPTEAQTTALSKELAERSALPAHVTELIRNFPKGMHPMTQFSMAIMGCQTESKFAKAYHDGVHKREYWNYW